MPVSIQDGSEIQYGGDLKIQHGNILEPQVALS